MTRDAEEVDDVDDMSMNAQNAMYLSNLIAEHPYLVLAVEHEVVLRGDKEVLKRGRYYGNKPRSKRKLRCTINLLDDLFKVLAVFTGMGSGTLPNGFLSCPENALCCTLVNLIMLRDTISLVVMVFDIMGVTWHDASVLVADTISNGVPYRSSSRQSQDRRICSLQTN